MESKAIEVKKRDIKNIGETAFGSEDGHAVFVCNLQIASIEEILLRNILSLYGYKIINFGEMPCSCEECEDIAGIAFGTNMPWDEYQKLKA
ncbi:hypothetical protein KAR91_85225 [Candidatus Pacearchaeota archaeon]|nr:hypothetical protein [Candidatus Pacearchaeota archaeon]